jgi:hypothetical protein
MQHYVTDIRILQLINAKALNRIDEDEVEISLPLAIPPRIEVNGLETNTQITITARPEGKYKNSKTVRYRRNTIQAEFDGYPDIESPTATNPVWEGIIYSEMIGLVTDVLQLFCIDPNDIDMESFGHMFPADSRGRRELDPTFLNEDGLLTVVLQPTQNNYYYNGPATITFGGHNATDPTLRLEENLAVRYLESGDTRLQDGVNA